MGLFWGLLCGFAFGCGDLLTRLGVRNGTPFTGAIINSGTTLIFFAVIVLVEGVQAGALWPAMGWFLLTGVVAIGPGRLLFYYSIRRIGVSRASVLVIITPLISMLTAVALLGERPSWRVVLGAVIIVGGLLSVVTDRGGILIDSRAALLGLLPTLFLSLTPFFIRLGMQSLPDPSLGTLLSSVGALTLLLMLQKAVPREDRWGADLARVPEIPRRGRMLQYCVLRLPRGPRVGNRQHCGVPRFHLAPVRHPDRPPSLSKARTNHVASRRRGRGGLYRRRPDFHLQGGIRSRAEGGPLFPPPWVSPAHEERSRLKDGLHDVRPRWHNVSRRKARRAFVRSSSGWISVFPLDFEGGAC